MLINEGLYNVTSKSFIRFSHVKQNIRHKYYKTTVFYIVLLLLAMKFILILSFNFVLFVHSKLFKFQRSGHRTYWLIVVFLPFSSKGHTRQTKQATLLKQEYEALVLLSLLLFLEYFFPFISSWSWSLSTFLH